MWCEIDPVELSAFVDGEVQEARAGEITRHVAACASCRGELERARKTDDSIRKPLPPHDLDALRADLMRRVDGIRRRSWLRIALPVGTAAAAIVIGLRLAGDHLPEARPPAAPPELRLAQHSPMLESLELDAASIRLLLLAEKPDPAVRTSLDARLDSIVNRIDKLRSTPAYSRK